MNLLKLFFVIILVLFMGACTNSDSDTLTPDKPVFETARVVGEYAGLSSNNWTELYNYGNQAYIFSYMPERNRRVYSYFYSSDNGENWTEKRTTPVNLENIRTIGFLNGKMYMQYADGNQLKLYSSEDGKNWDSREIIALSDDANVTGSWFRSAGCIADNGDMYLAVTYYMYKEEISMLELYRSTDRGVTFSKIRSKKYYSSNIIADMRNIQVRNSNIIINFEIGASFFTFISRSGGDQILMFADRNLAENVVDADDPGLIYFYDLRRPEGHPHGVYYFCKSKDSGITESYSKVAVSGRLLIRNSGNIARIDEQGVSQAKKNNDMLMWSDVNPVHTTKRYYSAVTGFGEDSNNKLWIIWADAGKMYLLKEK